MGTHPIFESDFDCLTEKMDSTKEIENTGTDRSGRHAWRDITVASGKMEDYSNITKSINLKKDWAVGLSNKSYRVTKTILQANQALVESNSKLKTEKGKLEEKVKRHYGRLNEYLVENSQLNKQNGDLESRILELESENNRLKEELSSRPSRRSNQPSSTGISSGFIEEFLFRQNAQRQEIINLMNKAAEEGKEFLLKNCATSKSADSSLQSEDIQNLGQENGFDSTSSTLKENSNLEESLKEDSHLENSLKSSIPEDESIEEELDESDEEFDPEGYSGLRKSMAPNRQSMACSSNAKNARRKTARMTKVGKGRKSSIANQEEAPAEPLSRRKTMKRKTVNFDFSYNESLIDDESINETVKETSAQDDVKSDSSPESSVIDPPDPSINVSTRRRSRRFSQLKKSTKSSNAEVEQEVITEKITPNELEKPPSKKSKPAQKPESEQIEVEVAAEPAPLTEMDKENYFQTPKKKWTEEKAINELNQRSSRRARKQVNYADPKGNTKMRRGDAICANTLVQSFSPKTTGRKRTI